MKKILSVLLALVTSVTFGATLNPISLLNPAGSTAGQAIMSTGGSTAPAWAGFLQSGAGAVSRSWPAKNQDVVSIKDYGAVCDGSTDDTAAINTAYAALPVNGALYIPRGVCKYTSALTFAGQKKFSIYGDGPNQSILQYSGANTTNDEITIGNGSTGEVNIYIKNIGLTSTTVMTAGAALHAKGVQRSILENVYFGSQDGNSNHYIGAWFDGIDSIWVRGFQARGSAEGIRLNGVTALGLADFSLIDGKIASCNVGLHIAGSLGGVLIDSVNIINNATNVLIDQSVTLSNNREVLFGPRMTIDSANSPPSVGTFNGIGVDIQDTGGFILFSGSWIASSGTNVRVGSSYGGLLKFDGGLNFNAFNAFGGLGRAIDNSSTTANIVINGTNFRNAQGAGIYSSVATSSIVLNNPYFKSDVVNPVSSNIAANANTTYGTSNLNVLGKFSVNSGQIYSSAVGGPTFEAAGDNVAIQSWNNVSGNPWLSLGHSRGTTPGSHVTLTTGDQLGGISFEGSDGTSFNTGASITSSVTTTPTTGHVPADLQFKTDSGSGSVGRVSVSNSGNFFPMTTNTYSLGTSGNQWSNVYSTLGTFSGQLTAAALTYTGILTGSAAGVNIGSNQLAINTTGNVAIGSGASAGQSLRVAKNVTGATTAFGVYSNGTVQSDVTAAAYMFYGLSGTQATAFTLPNLSVFRAAQGTVGAGSTITAQYGFNVDSGFTGATTNYGFYGSLASSAANWNFYASGTANNAFAGNVAIGSTTAPTDALTVTGAISHTQQDKDLSYTYNQPTTGQTVTLASGTQTAIIDPAGTLATLTVTLPGCTSGYNGSIARFSSSQIITGLTVNATSGSVIGGPSTLAIGAGVSYLCRGSSTTWYRLH